MRSVRVNASRTYDIWIGDGLLRETGRKIKALFAPCKVVLVSDDAVGALFGDLVMTSLREAGFDVFMFTFPHGERSKTMNTLSDILEFIGQHQLTKSDLVVALGGGVVGDMAGFAAAVYGRGMQFVQIPTTLLAAVDSSVGGKTGVNLSAGKNLAGVFAQPSMVLCDTSAIRPLPRSLVQDGAAEIIKYGVLEDAELLKTATEGQLMDNIEAVIENCVSIKRDYVSKDEFDRGRRQMLNLGHTVGHAVEKCSDFVITHGHAVAIGMMIIARAAWEMSISEENCAALIEPALVAYGLPTKSPFRADELLSAMQMDKKRRGDDITLVVPVRIGHCELMRVPVDHLSDWLEAGGVV